MFETYFKRIRQYCDIELLKADLEALTKRPNTDKLWICERAQNGAKTVSSEELAEQLQKIQISGAKRLWIVIGDADGWTKQELQQMKADLLWSFGPATYPHELASVIMCEQVYRAFTITKGHPYHSGHA